MANKLTIQHKRSSVAGNQPLPANLAVGELAINFADQKLYTKTGAGVIIPLGGGSKWTDETGGISRADMIRVGAAAAPLAAIDVTGSIVRDPVATTGDMNLLLSDRFTATITGATTFSFSGMPAAKSAEVVLRITNGGTGVVTWPGAVTWIAGSQPTLQSAGTDIILFWTHDGGTTWLAEAVGQSSGSTASTSKLPASFNPATDLTVDIPIGDGLTIKSNTNFDSAGGVAGANFRLEVVDGSGTVIFASTLMAADGSADPSFSFVKAVNGKTVCDTPLNSYRVTPGTGPYYARITVAVSTTWENIAIQ